jgi:aromatic-L-amino-acid decarboxylase
MELNSDDLQELGERVVAFITRYLQTLSDQTTLPEGLTPQRLRELLDEPLPRQPQGVDVALQDFMAKVAANSARIGHPRFMGWIRPSPLGAAIYAEALAATLNQSVAVWDGAPSATEVELRVIEWLKEMSCYAPQSGGLLTSGGSMANFICLLAARSHADPQAREQGLAGRPPFSLYITEETHYCVLKAAEMMGIGRRYVRFVQVDGALRMDPSALAKKIHADRRAGLRPLAVVATLGTVNSGACDDLLALGQVCREQGVWLHVDGAYGGLAAMLPGKRSLANGLAEADSLVFDPHKGLFMPFEAGCALVREPCHLYETFAVEADYLPNTEPCNQDGPFHFRDYGPQLSRSFRALKIYLALKIYGVDAIAAEIARLYDLATELGSRLQSTDDFELLAPVTLGIVAFRYRPAPPPGEPDPASWLNALNSQIVAEVQRRGQVFVSGTRIRDTVALRASFVSFRTRVSDLDILLDEIRIVGRSLCRS